MGRLKEKNGLFLVFILVSVKKIDDGPHRKRRSGIQLSCPMNYVLFVCEKSQSSTIKLGTYQEKNSGSSVLPVQVNFLGNSRLQNLVELKLL